jgi:hypothetical protein
VQYQFIVIVRVVSFTTQAGFSQIEKYSSPDRSRECWVVVGVPGKIALSVTGAVMCQCISPFFGQVCRRFLDAVPQCIRDSCWNPANISCEAAKAGNSASLTESFADCGADRIGCTRVFSRRQRFEHSFQCHQHFCIPGRRYPLQRSVLP